MRIRNYSRKHGTLQLLLMDLLQHLAHSMKATSCPDRVPRSGELQGTVGTVTDRSSTSPPLPCQTQSKDAKPLEPSPQLIKTRLHTTRNKTSTTPGTITSLLANRAISFSNHFQDLQVELHPSCLLNSTVTSLH